MTISDALRALVKKLGGTPKSNNIKGLITEALVASGKTPTGRSTSERIKEYVGGDSDEDAVGTAKVGSAKVQ